MNKEEIMDFVSGMLQYYEFEDFLELFDVSPEEAFYELFSSGFIDEELIYQINGRIDD